MAKLVVLILAAVLQLLQISSSAGQYHFFPAADYWSRLIPSTAGMPESLRAYWSRALPTTPVPETLQPFLTPATVDQFINPQLSTLVDYRYKYKEWSRSFNAVEDDPSGELFFLEKDLTTGSKINITFSTRTTAGVTATSFLPRQVANRLPFSSAKLDDILRLFSVPPGSTSATAIQQTLDYCEASPTKGVVKSCATSLESMIDFVVSQLGTNRVRVLVTTIEGREAGAGAHRDAYSVVGGGMVKASSGQDAVGCHFLSYPYTVFLCHKLPATRSYVVPLVSETDGKGVSGVSVCHLDTSAWSPEHLAFRVLHVKPGGLPVCHFQTEGDLTWVPA